MKKSNNLEEIDTQLKANTLKKGIKNPQLIYDCLTHQTHKILCTM